MAFGRHRQAKEIVPAEEHSLKSEAVRRGSDEVDAVFTEFRRTRSDKALHLLRDQVQDAIRSNRSAERRSPSMLWTIASPLLILGATAVTIILIFGICLVLRDYVIHGLLYPGNKSPTVVVTKSHGDIRGTPVTRLPNEHHTPKRAVSRQPEKQVRSSQFAPVLSRPPSNVTTEPPAALICTSCLITGVSHVIDGATRTVQAIANPALEAPSQLIQSAGRYILTPLLGSASTSSSTNFPGSQGPG
jgi:hypothetical protein